MQPGLTRISEFDVIAKSYSTVHLDWSSSLLEYKYSILNETDRVYCIVQQIVGSDEDEAEWNDIYIGYGKSKIVEDLQPKKEYKFRIRFHRSDDVYSAWSPTVQVITDNEPYYGENLHKAVRNRSMAEIKTVLNSGNIIVDVRDDHGLSALMNTAKLGQTDVMKMLLSFNASVNAKDESGKTALMHACFHGQLPAVKLLIENGALYDDYDLGGSSAIHYAIDSCNCELIEWIFKSGADVNCRDRNAGWTPLMRCASLTGNSIVAMTLIHNGANVNLQDSDGKTCLMIAVINGHQKFVEVLLENDADTTIINKSGRSAYDMAISLEKRVGCCSKN
ncbi:fibronectin type 3 and ankyrin repeat domains 1 protein isoform X2 [Octopus bimaculoides]|uniref:fibronectin type 3 and ankyrin repeat domains 1 protein isoform X2 n=1 Tax=Octopus bimaculoides TaxID=37653 RepID=UPI00071C8707|nr:fibronectin type 3 and ankyrin repeat domains 1 protein isoform X2 [Octopus bimaculoides]|eukprot:XP_014769355.1 PREDICTED: fibronectin type 3 and ankyrin repeat domains 1 protein-like isoform X2 [Octopus bimaculoides]